MGYTSYDSNYYLSLRGRLDEKDLQEIIAIGEMDRIQADFMPHPEDLAMLNEHYYSRYPQTGLRLYALGEKADLSVLACMTNIQKLSIQTNRSVDHIEVLSQLLSLKKLQIYVDLLNNFDFIDDVPISIEQFALSTKSKAFDLSRLTRFTNLKVLRLIRYKKNIDALAALSELVSLNIEGVTPESLAFINTLQNLKRLKIHYGNINDFSELYGNESITALKLFRITNLADAEIIAQLPNMEAVELSWLRHIDKLPDLSEHKKLKHVLMDDMKTLTDLSGLEHCASLESFHFSVCPSIFEQEHLLPVLRNPSVRQCSVYTSSTKKNEQFRKLIKESGKINDNNNKIIRKLLYSSEFFN